MNKQRLKKTIRRVRDLKKDYKEQIENYESEFLGIGVIKPKIEAWKRLLAIGFTPTESVRIFKMI